MQDGVNRRSFLGAGLFGLIGAKIVAKEIEVTPPPDATPPMLYARYNPGSDWDRERVLKALRDLRSNNIIVFPRNGGMEIKCEV